MKERMPSAYRTRWFGRLKSALRALARQLRAANERIAELEAENESLSVCNESMKRAVNDANAVEQQPYFRAMDKPHPLDHVQIPEGM